MSDRRPSILIGLAAVLALGALSLSVYLSIQSLVGDTVAGCGGGSSCGEVLSSRWAKLGPIPVALLGALTHVGVLLGLGLRGWSKGDSRLGDTLLCLAAPLLLIAAIWFSYLQIVEIGAICPYCMADHAIGFVLAILLVCIVGKSTRLNPKPALAVGLLAGLSLIPIQLFMPVTEDIQRAPNPFVDRDGDVWIDDARYLSMFGGELQFVLQDVHYIGDENAQQVVAIVFDYACPFCRTLHERLEEMVADDPERFVLVPLAVTIDDRHNPHASSENPRFDDSFERALLSMAVAAIDLEKWRTFDRWLFAMDEPDAFPRSALDARIKAEQLVGLSALNEQLTDENLAKHQQSLEGNIELLGLLPLDQRFIPVTTTPGAAAHLTERFEEPNVLLGLLDAARANLAGKASQQAAPDRTE